MNAHLLPTIRFLQHLRSERAPFVVVRSQAAPKVRDAEQHDAAFQHGPELYALCGVADKVQPGQRERILFALLARSWAGLAPETRHEMRRVVRGLLAALEPERVLTVFLGLRRARVNHRHAARTVLRYLLNHPALETLAQRRRPAVVDCIEHALGRNVARGAVRCLLEGTDPDYVHRHLLHFAREPERAAAVLAFLYGKAPCPPARDVAPAITVLAPTPEPERPKTVTATNRGDVAATLVHLYQGGDNAELREALARYVREAAAKLPRFDGRVAVVLDASASTRGYGEREFCCVAQSQALRLCLEQCCAEVSVVTVGGSGELPAPEGDTDLATALLDALESEPDVVAIVTDGYENVADGDLARVVASLPAAGVTTPVVFCHSKFTGKDDLALRRPAPMLPELEFWHQDDFAELLWMLFAHSRQGAEFVRQQLRQRLANLEQLIQ